MTTRDIELHEEKPEIETFVILRVLRGSRFNGALTELEAFTARVAKHTSQKLRPKTTLECPAEVPF
jgi:hypothetical protein